MRSKPFITNLWIVLMWGGTVLVALTVRPLLPVDETRYLAVAWDMWLEGHYLVPHLNGDPYSHKPPLLFWLMTAGWHIFGINEWWPRLVAPVFGLGTVLLTGSLGNLLWPSRNQISNTAPLFLVGTLFWSVFVTLTMFDMILAFFNLAAINALILAAKTGRLRWFLIAGLMIGLGLLAKGPAILIHYLPVAISAPWWLRQLADANNWVTWSWKTWYFGVAVSIFCAVVVGLTWAIPAGIAGGEPYRDAIFWGQSAGRVINSFAHARPFWWYALMLPGLILPWFVWPPLWRSAATPKSSPDCARRLCIIWFASAFTVFTFFSGKQAHYLLPEFPALALLAARAIRDNTLEMRIDSLFPGGLFVIFGAGLLIIPNLSFGGRLAETIAETDVQWGFLILASGMAVIVFRLKVFGLCVVSSLTIFAVYFVAAPVLAARYDLAPIAREIKTYQTLGRAVANFGKYHGQYNFLGRLMRPITVIGQVSGDEKEFLSENPDGIVVAYYENLPQGPKPLSTHTYRRFTVAIWPVRTLKDYPGIAERQ